MKSVSNKILFGYAAVLLVTIIAAVLLTQTSRGVEGHVATFMDNTLPQLEAAEKIGSAISHLEISAFSLYGTTINVAGFDSERQTHSDSMASYFKVIEAEPGVSGLQRTLAQYHRSLDQLRQVMATKPVHWDRARDRLGDLSNTAETARNELQAIQNHVQQTASISSQAIEQELSASARLVIILVSVIAAFAVVAFMLSRQQIARPIIELSRTLENVSNNRDLTQQLNSGSNDEIGQAATSVNQLLGLFHAGMSDVAGAIHGISQSVATLGNSSESSDTAVARLNQEIDHLVEIMVGLESQIEHSVTRSAVASETAAKGATEVQQGAREVANTSSSIAALAGDIETTATMLLQLRTAGDQVSSVVSTIAEIADQTNLLALNAAIEAARAGESGRGFAVVADEVRTLASKTHQSTVEINTMLANIVTSITQSVDTMASNQEKAQHSVELAQVTVASLSNIEQTILDLSQTSAEVAQLAGGVRQEVTSVRGQVNEFKGLGDTVAQGSGETRQASATLGELSASLTSLVGRFKV